MIGATGFEPATSWSPADYDGVDFKLTTVKCYILPAHTQPLGDLGKSLVLLSKHHSHINYVYKA